MENEEENGLMVRHKTARTGSPNEVALNEHNCLYEYPSQSRFTMERGDGTRTVTCTCMQCDASLAMTNVNVGINQVVDLLSSSSGNTCIDLHG